MVPVVMPLGVLLDQISIRVVVECMRIGGDAQVLEPVVCRLHAEAAGPRAACRRIAQLVNVPGGIIMISLNVSLG